MTDESLLRTRVLTLPTADSYRRGQFLLLENPAVADDRLYYGIQVAAGTYALKEIPFGPLPATTVIVQEGDTTIEALATTFDFDASSFVVTSSPSGEANIELAYGTGAGTPAEGNHTHDPFIPFTRLFFDDTGGSTSSTTIYTPVISGSFTLPDGTWTLEANAWGRLGNDAASSVDIRMTIDGTTGTVYTRTGSTVANPGGGSRTVTCAIKSDTTGLSTMTNVHMIVNAYRTA
jgi:hypothetical protein